MIEARRTGVEGEARAGALFRASSSSSSCSYVHGQGRKITEYVYDLGRNGVYQCFNRLLGFGPAFFSNIELCLFTTGLIA